VTINGRLTKPGQRESARVTVQPGTVYRIAIEAARFGSALDGVLTIRDSAGKVLTEIDDTTAPAVPGQPAQQQPDPSLKYTVPAGVNEIELGVRDQRGRGGVGFGYRLTIEPALPVFSAILTSTDHADRITGRGNGTECRECSECARASRSDRGPRHGRRDQHPGGTADGDRSVGTGA
jgi:hypothetical protein